jgi:hypothetical protein
VWYVAVSILDQFSLVLSRRKLVLEASEQPVCEERLLQGFLRHESRFQDESDGYRPLRASFPESSDKLIW